MVFVHDFNCQGYQLIQTKRLLKTECMESNIVEAYIFVQIIILALIRA